MDPPQELIDSIYVEKVMRARRASIERKLLDGPELFAFACQWSRAGIRMDHPNATPDEVERLLKQRIELGEELEEAAIERS